MENRADFTGRVVVDVGAGSGILSLFAAQVLSVIVDGFVLFYFLFFLKNKIEYKNSPFFIRFNSSVIEFKFHALNL